MYTNCIYICIDNYWFDASKYNHPGGKKILQKYHLKDATDAFNEISGHVEAYHLLEKYEIKDQKLLKELFLISKN
jgi:cytochrome b involved in lipid metabolism